MTSINWMDLQGLGSFEDAEPAPASEGRGDALLADLNEPQRAAVTHASGPLLILAGAGSGKTRVITRRIAWLVTEGWARPHELCAITFTNKAAREMRERVEAVLPTRGMWISTFHSMCARILRREIEVLEPPSEEPTRTRDFSIYDTADKNQLLKELIRDAGYDLTRLRPAAMGAWISDLKNAVDEPDFASGAGGFEEEALEKVRAAYELALRRNNALDFDDLLLRVHALFERHPGVRDAYAYRFRYVLVDEYQDTNRVQYELTRHLASAHGNLAVCGDPDQSIYSWRGADIRNILDFEHDFGAATVVRLEQNYRSTGNVLAAAQAVIRYNVGRKEKDLWSEREAGPLVAVLECADEEDEAAEVVAQIRGARAQGLSLDSVAVFYRANFMQRAIERALRFAAVPYRIVAGVEFFQRREIRDLVAYLRLIVNPDDEVACARVINVPQRGVGQKSLALLAEHGVARGLSLRRAAGDEEARAALRGRARAGVVAFDRLMSALEQLAGAPADVALDRVIAETGYLRSLSELDETDLEARVENVEELRAHAQKFDSEHPGAGLRGFLQDVALVSETDGPGAEGESDGRVTLMTLHAAKGLEFPMVVIAGLEEELLPHARALAETADADAALEEERRLFYVGMTRAQERLVLTWAGRRFHYGQSLPRMRSRFAGEIPADLVDGGHGGGHEDDFAFAEHDEAPDVVGLRVGVWVEHDHFGRGLVERLQGEGANARATVSFGSHGTKQLLLQYAKLRVLG